jgi:hypothetical protein
MVTCNFGKEKPRPISTQRPEKRRREEARNKIGRKALITLETAKSKISLPQEP